ncbi:MAG: hypothetical protein JWN46_3602 [Acidimicrobiales bacterium]|nr:hypothetical protein [Acidimicrobiales bacterium]
MFKLGSKLWYGLAAFGFLAAFVYAGASGHHAVGMETFVGAISLGYKGRVGDHLGYAVLVSLGFVSLFVGIVLSALRDADPEAAAQVVGLDTVPAVEAPRTASFWPLVGAFSLAALALGLAVDKLFFVVGLVGLAITVVEWAVRNWADRATGDPEVNRAIRHRLMFPVEIPGIALVGIGLFVLLISRVLLALPEVGSSIVFGLVPVAVLAVGALVALKPKVSSTLVAVLMLVGGMAILAGGIAAGIKGERKIEKHVTQHQGLNVQLHPGAPQGGKVGG